jgi:hypothetical protein
LGNIALAQETSSLGVFIASPVGDFGSTSIDKGGFAQSGWGIVLDSRNKLKFLPERWSLYLHSTYQWNTLNTQAVADKFTAKLGLRTTVSNSKYNPLLTTIGPAYDIPVSEKVSIGLRGSIGVMFNSTKAMTIKVYDAANTIIANELVNFDNNPAFAYTLGGEIRFVLVKDAISLALYADYTSANQTTDVTFTTADPSSSFEKLQYINTGFKFVFFKKRA